MNANALLIFVKNPIPGKTKTRLAASVGNEMALKMYHQLVAYTRNQAAGLDSATRYVYYSDHVGKGDAWGDEKFVKAVQKGADLGQRMENAFAACFAAGHQRVCIIGSDCPGVTTDLLERAFATLEEKDVVVGPALDGGYYLLGSRQPSPQLFRGVEWSSERTLEQTLARTQEPSLTVGHLEPLSDVDYLEDWERYGWPLPE